MGMLLSIHITRGWIAVRHFDLKGLCQSQNSFVTDKDPRGGNVSLYLSPSTAHHQPHSTNRIPNAVCSPLLSLPLCVTHPESSSQERTEDTSALVYFLSACLVISLCVAGSLLMLRLVGCGSSGVWITAAVFHKLNCCNNRDNSMKSRIRSKR